MMVGRCLKERQLNLSHFFILLLSRGWPAWREFRAILFSSVDGTSWTQRMIKECRQTSKRCWVELERFLSSHIYFLKMLIYILNYFNFMQKQFFSVALLFRSSKFVRVHKHFFYMQDETGKFNYFFFLFHTHILWNLLMTFVKKNLKFIF